MQDGSDWLMRPVLQGMCLYSELIDGTLDLMDVALMNEALDCDEVNQGRLSEAAKRGR